LCRALEPLVLRMRRLALHWPFQKFDYFLGETPEHVVS